MKKLLPFILCIGFVACSDEPKVVTGPPAASTELEKSALSCWSKNWSSEAGYDISEGIKLVDDYLFKNGYLGKRTIEDYKKFFTGSDVIYIPDTVQGYAKMKLALNSDFAGSPNVDGMISCWKSQWFEKMGTLDSSDVVRRTGKLVKDLAEAGPPDVNKVAPIFFKDLTVEELDRPLIKCVAYFVFWKNAEHATHIIFVKPEVNSNDSLVTPVK